MTVYIVYGDIGVSVCATRKIAERVKAEDSDPDASIEEQQLVEE